MFTLFRNPKSFIAGTVQLPIFRYPLSGLVRNISIMQSYYQTRSYILPQDHILNQILTSLNVPLNLPVSEYYKAITHQVPRLVRSFGLIDDYNPGKNIQNGIYNQSLTNYMLSDETYFNPYRAEKEYKKLTPLKVVYHPFNHLTASSDYRKHSGSGVTVVSLNIAMLAIMHRTAILSGSESYMPHLTRYTLPNMLQSHLDTAIVNLLISHALGIPRTHYAGSLPIFNTDYTPALSRAQKALIKLLTSRERDYSQILASIPLTEKSALQWSVLPDIAPTRQYAKIPLLSRMYLYLLLTSLSEKNGNLLNRNENNQIKRGIEIIYSTQALSEIHDPIIKADIKELYQRVAS